MNRIYRLVWSQVNQAWIAVAEHARGHGKSFSARKLGAAAATLAGSSLLISAAWAADASNAKVVGGSGSVMQSGATTTINQSSQRLAIDWTSLSTATNEKLNFVQPNAQAIALNRIIGSSPSTLLGSLTANGQVFILNPNGVLFGAGAQVNVGGIVASTLTMSAADFMNGSSTLSKDPAKTGAVVNQGDITAADGGYVALISGTVSNQGNINSRLGTTLLAAGDKVTLNLNNGTLMGYTIDQGALRALVENKQLIQADGGQVLMAAKALDKLSTAVINNTGIVEARTVQNRNGRIMLIGDVDVGTVNLAGTLDASAPTAGDGGFVETSAAHVKVADGTTVTTLAALGQGKSGIWLIDPTDFTVAASGGDISGATLSANLGNGDVQLQSTQGTAAGSGDININDAVSWDAATALTLSAQRNININRSITATNATGKVALEYGLGNVSAGNTATYNVNAPINLQAGDNFSTRLGSDGATVQYKVITSLGSEGSTTGTDLQGMTNGNFVLGADIDAVGTSNWNNGWGFLSMQSYAATFDGLGHSIKNLKALSGLFDSVQGGTVRNVSLTGVDIGGVAGVNASYAGAVAGSSQNGTFTNVSATGSISGGSAGGLIGNNVGGAISNSEADVTITQSVYAGGLVGYNNGGAISDSHASGNIGADSYAGGLIGANMAGSLNNVYATGTVVAGGNGGGGLVGLNSGVINNAYADVTMTTVVFSNGNVGGLVGKNDGTITNSYASGNLFAEVWDLTGIGGLVGMNNGTISHAYANNKVEISLGISPTSHTGIASVGGLVGVNNGAIDHAFVSGTVTNTTVINSLQPVTTSMGALVGTNAASGTIASSYWDSTSTTQSSAIGTNNASASAGAGATALTGNAVYSHASYSAYGTWNETASGSGVWVATDGSGKAWAMVEGSTRPFLYSEYSTTVDNAHQLQLMALNLGANYTLGNDIDASSTSGGGSSMWSTQGFASIGNNAASYGGAFDGGDHVISNIVINRPASDNAGLFGVSSGTIGNVRMSGGSVIGGNAVGALAGVNSGTISNVTSDVSVSGAGSVGGLVGSNSGSISAAQTSGKVAGTAQNVGGVAGVNSGSLSKSYATGDVSGAGNVGGLVGSNASTGSLNNDYAEGNVSAASGIAGGLVGQNSGSIDEAYALGSVTGATGAGGLAGANSGTVTNAYATGQVTASSGAAGGLAGANTGTLSGSYWDSATTGQSAAAGSGSGSGASAITGNAAYQHASYAGLGTWAETVSGSGVWVASDGSGKVWAMIEGSTRPFLYSEYSTTIGNLHQLQLAALDLGAGYTLSKDVDARMSSGSNAADMWSTKGFAPIGNGSVMYSGVFDGGNHVITNLVVNRPTADYVGLFGALSGTIRNVGMIGGSVTGANMVGGLVGDNAASGVISNVFTTGNVSGANAVGGVLGVNDAGATLNNAHAEGNVTASAGGVAGGLVGQNAGAIDLSYAVGDVSSSGASGALTGANTGTLGTSYASGRVNNAAAGLTGSAAYLHSSYAGYGTWKETVPGSGVWIAYDGSGAPVWALFEGSTRPFLYSEYSTTVRNLHQLQLMALNVTENYTLASNIDATATNGANSSNMWSTKGFVPVGGMPASSGGTSFRGTFDGGNHLINNLTINRPTTNYVGLFGLANAADIKNIGMVGGSVTGSLYTGGLVGYIDSGSISNAYTTGSVAGDADAGGLIGSATIVTINNVHATGNVTGDTFSGLMGGLIGNSIGTHVTNAYATGDVVGSDQLGGLIGLNTGVVTDAYATGKVTSIIPGSDISNGPTGGIGGFIGLNKGNLTNVYATGDVTGGYYAGGLVGQGDQGGASGTISNAHATGNVTGAFYAGGLVGDYYTNMSDVYATGNVSGQEGGNSGGLVGRFGNSGGFQIAITNAYATGNVTSQAQVNSPDIWNLNVANIPASAFGGLIGRTYGGARLTNVHASGNVTLNQTTALTVVYFQTDGSFATPTQIAQSSQTLPSEAEAYAFAGGLVGNSGGFVNMETGIPGSAGSATGTYRSGGDAITNAYATGNVILTETVTGALPDNLPEPNYRTAVTVGAYAGGLIGNKATVSYGRGGADYGFAAAQGEAAVSNAYASGNVSVTLDASQLAYGVAKAAGGGLIGQGGNVTNAYASGDIAASMSAPQTSGISTFRHSGRGEILLPGESVMGTFFSSSGTSRGTDTVYAGGLIGKAGDSFAGSSIGDTYATGNATASITAPASNTFTNAYAGGLAGGWAGTISSSFWNTDTSSLTNGIGTGSSTGVTGITNTAASQLATYANAGWNIDATGGTGSIWRIYDGQTGPLLRSFLSAITVTGDAASKTYNGDSSIAATYNTSIDSAALDGDLAYVTSRNAGSYSSAAGTLTQTGLYSDQQGYDISYADTSLTIDKANVTLSSADVVKTYDGTTSANGSMTAISGQLFGGDSAAATSYAFNDKNAGAGKTVVASGVTINDGNGGNNYNLNYANNTSSSINKAALVISSGDVTKTYDGTTSATGSAIATAGTQVFNGDSISGGSFAYADKNAGIGDKSVSVSGVTVNDGNGGNNYNVSYADNATSTINKAALVLSSSDANKIYDGTTTANSSAVAVAGTQVFGGDSIGGGSFAYADKNAGTGKAVSVSGVMINDGNGGNNYSVSYVDNIHSTIDKADLNVSASGVNKVYDGSTTASVSYTDTRIAGDALNINGSASFTDKNTGSGKTVDVNGIAISGADADNYRLVSSSASTSADITQATVTVAANSVDKFYDGVAYAGNGGITVTGLAASDTLADLGVLTYGGSAQDATGIGTYVIAPGGLTASGSNYRVVFVNGQLSIKALSQTSAALGGAALEQPYDAARQSVAIGANPGDPWMRDTLDRHEQDSGWAKQNAAAHDDGGNYIDNNKTSGRTIPITPRLSMIVSSKE